MDYLLPSLVVLLVLAWAWHAWQRRSAAKVKRPRPLEVLPEQFITADIETTGLDPSRHEIIEIAAIRVNRDSEWHQTFTGLVKPKRKVSAKVTSITGITNDMLEREGEALESVMVEFLEFVGSRPLVFYNAEFDMGFLVRAARRVSRRIDNPVASALAMAREAWPDLPSYNLGNLCRTAGCHGWSASGAEGLRARHARLWRRGFGARASSLNLKVL
jgi:DNA polymerase-3 subunit epsilon